MLQRTVNYQIIVHIYLVFWKTRIFDRIVVEFSVFTFYVQWQNRMIEFKTYLNYIYCGMLLVLRFVAVNNNALMMVCSYKEFCRAAYEL